MVMGFVVSGLADLKLQVARTSKAASSKDFQSSFDLSLFLSFDRIEIDFLQKCLEYFCQLTVNGNGIYICKPELF